MEHPIQPTMSPTIVDLVKMPVVVELPKQKGSWIMITRSYTFDSAHMLDGHSGKCANLHGHTYGVTVAVAGYLTHREGATDDGMLLDYTDLDAAMKPLIDKMDHAFLSSGEEKILEGLRLLARPTKIFTIGMRTTAENLAVFIAHEIGPKLKREYTNVKSISVTVRETPKSEAAYEL